MLRIQHTLIMAAGRGLRMSPLTDVVPKPMAPLMNSTLIGIGISKIRDQMRGIHVTVGYKGAMLAQHLIERGADSIFNTEGHGNAWWLYHTLMKQLDEPIFVLTCDNVTDIDFASLESDYLRAGEPPCMLVPVQPVVGVDGDYIFHEQQVVTQLSRTQVSDIYCSGIQIINPAKVNQLTEQSDSFYEVWRQLIAERLALLSTVQPKAWFSVDTLADLEKVKR